MKRAAVVLAALLGALFVIIVAAPLATATAPGDSVRIRVIGADNNDVPDVELTVTGPDGFEETVTTTGDQFTEVPVPGPGSYTITIDEDTIPDEEGASSREEITVEITPGLSKTALFRLGAEERETQGFLDEAIDLFVSGLVFGLIIAMAAIGLSLIYGTTGLTNFAHGELVTLGALVTYIFNNTWGLPLVLAAALAVVVCGALGGVQDWGFWRQLRKRGTGLIAMLVVSIGLGLFLRNLYLFLFEGGTEQFADYGGQGPLNFGPVSITPKALIGSGIAVVLLLATAWWLLRTRIGKATRAVSDNPALASASGIDVERVINIVWILGAGLAAYAGVLLGLQQGVNFQMGFQILLLVFAGVTLGGLGTAFGALVGSLIVGVVIELSTLWIPTELKSLGALVVLILILLIRPQGILGRRERIG